MTHFVEVADIVESTLLGLFQFEPAPDALDPVPIEDLLADDGDARWIAWETAAIELEWAATELASFPC